MNIQKSESANSTLTSKKADLKPEYISQENITPPIPSFTSFSGPIPPPNVLKEYDRLFPGIAQKFLEGPHEEAKHRRDLEKKNLEEQIKLSKIGQWMAFLLAISCISGAFIAIFLGFDVAGLAALLLSLASMVGMFLYSKKQVTVENSSKKN